MRLEDTRYFSKKIGKLAKGCRQCVRGEKLVLFITGICPRHCYYCPINDRKYQQDDIYANERKIKKVSEAIEEAEACSSKGAGITGGDPLAKADKTVRYIKALKKRFGKKFHIHLYTSFDLVDEKKLKKLSDAGLDEIRFHADVEDSRFWDKAELAQRFDWDTGIEIPMIPGKLKETKKLIDFFHDKIGFLNLNELEIADNEMSRLSKMGFDTKDKISYAVKGSSSAAEKLMRHILDKGYRLDVHFCTAKLKDKVQLGERLKRRAKNIAKPYDIVDEEGLLVRGALYCKNALKLKKELAGEFDIPEDLIEADKERGRVLTGAWIVEDLKDELKAKSLKVAVVEEYPTWDRLTVSVDFL